MRRSRFVMIMLIFTCLSCEIDKFKLGDCNGDYCIGASGYVYDILTDEPLAGASIKITYKENCGFCGTGCPFREFEIGTVMTNGNGYFQTNFSSKEFKEITGSYVFDLAYNEYIEENVWISNDGQKELFIESSLNPPAYLNLSISLIETDNINYFGLTMRSDSSSGRHVGGYNSNRSGLFSDTTVMFRVPAERIIYFGYLIEMEIGEKRSNDSIFINRFETEEYQISE